MPNDPAIFPKQAMHFKGQNPATFAFQIMGAGICKVTVDLSSDESLRQDTRALDLGYFVLALGTHIYLHMDLVLSRDNQLVISSRFNLYDHA